MLNKLIPHIDLSIAELKYFSRIYGLAEKIKGNQEKAEEFPAVFIGNDNYEQVNLELLCCYHRIAGERSLTITSDNTTGCSDGFEMIYPMVFVGCLKHSRGCEVYESDLIANSVANKLFQVRFNKEIAAQVKTRDIKLYIRKINTNRNEIWDEEYSNVENKMNFDMIYFSVKYDLSIRGDNNCLNIIEC